MTTLIFKLPAPELTREPHHVRQHRPRAPVQAGDDLERRPARPGQGFHAAQGAVERAGHPAQAVVQLGRGAVERDRHVGTGLAQHLGLPVADEGAVALHAQLQAHLAQPAQDIENLGVHQRLAAGQLDRAQAQLLRLDEDLA